MSNEDKIAENESKVPKRKERLKSSGENSCIYQFSIYFAGIETIAMQLFFQYCVGLVGATPAECPANLSPLASRQHLFIVQKCQSGRWWLPNVSSDPSLQHVQYLPTADRVIDDIKMTMRNQSLNPNGSKWTTSGCETVRLVSPESIWVSASLTQSTSVLFLPNHKY